MWSNQKHMISQSSWKNNLNLLGTQIITRVVCWSPGVHWSDQWRRESVWIGLNSMSADGTSCFSSGFLASNCKLGSFKAGTHKLQKEIESFRTFFLIYLKPICWVLFYLTSLAQMKLGMYMIKPNVLFTTRPFMSDKLRIRIFPIFCTKKDISDIIFDWFNTNM